MPIKNKLLALSASTALLFGCVQQGPEQRFNVVGANREMTANEAIALIKASNDLTISANEAEVSRQSQGLFGYSNHPVLNLNADSGKLPSILIRKGESLVSAAERLKHLGSFTRVVFDLTPGTIPPGSVVSKQTTRTIGNTTLIGEVVAFFDADIPDLNVFSAHDNAGNALVFSNKKYERWQHLSVFDVNQGDLKKNSVRLAATMSWKLDDKTAWLAKNYGITRGYPLVIINDDPHQAFGSLLREYPAQALLDINTRSVTVIERTQPRNTY